MSSPKKISQNVYGDHAPQPLHLQHHQPLISHENAKRPHIDHHQLDEEHYDSLEDNDFECYEDEHNDTVDMGEQLLSS
jgi:hypothetical protein